MTEFESEDIENIDEVSGTKVAKKEMTAEEKLKIIKARQSIASRKYHEKKKREQEEKLRNPTIDITLHNTNEIVQINKKFVQNLINLIEEVYTDISPKTSITQTNVIEMMEFIADFVYKHHEILNETKSREITVEPKPKVKVVKSTPVKTVPVKKKVVKTIPFEVKEEEEEEEQVIMKKSRTFLEVLEQEGLL
jgi:hypothetical protein